MSDPEHAKPFGKPRRCERCGKPLAQVSPDGNVVRVLTHGQGEKKTKDISIQYEAGGRFEVTCDCGGSFARTDKAIPGSYVVTPPGESGSVDKSN